MRTAPLSLLLVATFACAGSDGLFSERVDTADGRVIVIAEAQLEPRSIGSYSIRMYSGRNPKFPYDDFLTGVIHPRDGMIIAARLSDVGGDEIEELIVTMQSAGSGGYLAADAFALNQDTITRIAHVEGLATQADVATALRAVTPEAITR